MSVHGFHPFDKDKTFTCVSEEGNMKFHRWNTGLGGTCPDYAVVCQFRTKAGKTVTVNFCKGESEPAWVSEVHSIRKDDSSTFYIATRSHQASGNDGYMWVEAFVIDHDTLKTVSVYDVKDDLDERGPGINYSISSWYYTTDGEGWDWLFEYDVSGKDLYIPKTVYIENNMSVISDRYRVYHFNGKEFVDKGESAHKGLHESLGNYYRLARYFWTKNHLVRVDWMNHKGTLRFALWKSALDMSRQPDIVIQGGIYDEKKDTYTFKNDGYKYVVGYSEIKQVSKGKYEHHELLLVKIDCVSLLTGQLMIHYNTKLIDLLREPEAPLYFFVLLNDPCELVVSLLRPCSVAERAEEGEVHFYLESIPLWKTGRFFRQFV